MLAVLTNSTYDGLCYDVEHTTRLLSQSVDRIHYDEAWYAYARFHPLYEGRYGMHRGKRSKDDATVTVTHSTHKLLAALSQASMIHIREGRIPVEPALFNEAFMMHTSTSPQYSIIASTDVSAKMMDDAGPALMNECIREAIDFRRAMLRIGRDLEKRKSGDWWFQTWQTDEVGKKSFLDADPDELASSTDAWLLKPKQAWHGFGDLGAKYCMLDPIKVTTLTPGIGAERQADQGRHPRLDRHGVPRHAGDRGREDRALLDPHALLDRHHARQVGIAGRGADALQGALRRERAAREGAAPDRGRPPRALREARPARSRRRDARRRTASSTSSARSKRAFSDLPEPVLSPRDTFARLVHRDVEQVPAAKLEGRILAVQVVPYPPGIPLLMPGERFGKETRGVGDFLLGLEAIDAKFPGFAHDTHGVEVKTDKSGRSYYALYCLKE